MEGREQNFKYPAVDLPLVVSIDGETLGRFILNYSSQSSGVVRCFTPFLRAGAHKVRVYWDNVAAQCSLRVDAVRLQSVTGSDLNANGFKDWMENRLYSQCGIDATPPTSFVSPVCLEGRGQYLSMMSLAAGNQAMLTPIPVQRGAGRRWYADVPLNPSAGTQVEISYQNGGLVETREIFWQETNLLEANNMTVRKGDSLLLTAVPAGITAGEVRITVVGVTNYVTDVSTPVAHRFGQAGTFTVRGRYVPTGAVRAITVKVVEASLDPLVATWVDKRRLLDCTNLPPSVVVDADPRLKMGTFYPKILGTNGRQISLLSDEAEPRAIVARLGRKGPILASSAVEGFRLSGSAETYLRQLAVYPDGSQLIEAAFILSPVVPQVSVELRVLVSGVTFDDGTVTKVLTSADFDALGMCRVRFLRAAGVVTSVCHATKVYQNGVLVGWPSNPK